MIKKILKNTLVFSAKRNNKNELVLIVSYDDFPEIKQDLAEVNRVGLNALDCIEIHAISDKDIIEYQMPYKEELVHLIKKFKLDHVVLGLSESRTLDLDTPIEVAFEGFLRLYHIKMED